MREYPGLQLPLLLAISVFRQVYLIRSKPYIERNENMLSVFNELLVSAYLILLLLITDFNGNVNIRYIVSFALLSVIGVYIIVNLGVFFSILSKTIFMRTRRYYMSKNLTLTTSKEESQTKDLVEVKPKSDLQGKKTKVYREKFLSGTNQDLIPFDKDEIDPIPVYIPETEFVQPNSDSSPPS